MIRLISSAYALTTDGIVGVYDTGMTIVINDDNDMADGITRLLRHSDDTMRRLLMDRFFKKIDMDLTISGTDYITGILAIQIDGQSRPSIYTVCHDTLPVEVVCQIGHVSLYVDDLQ